MRRSPAHGDGRYRAADPMALLPTGVSTALVHGTADDAVPVDLSRVYAAAATAAGDDCRMIEIPEGNHMDVIDPASDVWEEVTAAVAAVT